MDGWMGVNNLRQTNRHGGRINTLHGIANEGLLVLDGSTGLVEGDLVGDDSLEELEKLGLAIDSVGNLVLLLLGQFKCVGVGATERGLAKARLTYAPTVGKKVLLVDVLVGGNNTPKLVALNNLGGHDRRLDRQGLRGLGGSWLLSSSKACHATGSSVGEPNAQRLAKDCLLDSVQHGDWL